MGIYNWFIVSNEYPLEDIENVDQLLWQQYIGLIQETGNGDNVLTGLTYQEAVRVVEGLFQQSLTIPYEEKTPEEQVAYIHIASLHHNTFGES